MSRSPSRTGASTLADVARAAGVSVATASRALTGRGHASPHAQAAVRRAAAELGYTPHPLAVSLARGRGQRVVIGIVAPVPELLTDQYPTRLVGAAALAADGYGMGVSARWLRPGAGASLRELARDRSVHGVVLVNHTAELIDALPPALRSRATAVGPGFGRVACHDVDVTAAMELRIQHLIESGRRRIAMLAGPAWLPSLRRPVEVYRESLAGYGLPARTVAGESSAASGRARTRAVLRRWPDTDAIVAVTDVTAMGALAALAERGLRVPDDVAVVGFDDVPIAAMGQPPLTTVTHPVELIAAGAVGSLLSGAVNPGDSVVHPATLVRRRSA